MARIWDLEFLPLFSSVVSVFSVVNSSSRSIALILEWTSMRTYSMVLLGILWASPLVARETPSADEQFLQSNRIDTSGPGLLTFIKHRTVTARDAIRIRDLIKELGDDDFETREKASNGLIVLGSRARPALLTASRDPDPEVVQRAQDCLKEIDQGVASQLVSAAVRLLALKKPADSVEVLLAYLPSVSVEEESVADDVINSLTALAVQNGKAHPVLVAALTDRDAVRRMGAAEALARTDLVEHAAEVRKLLADPDPHVRLRLAMALVSGRDKEAVPVLIQLLGEAALTSRETGRIEDFLYRVAADLQVPILKDTDVTSRRDYSKAWAAWWKEHGAAVKPEVLASAVKTGGFTLVVLLDEGAVVDLDKQNRPRFRLNNLDFPLDVQYLPGDHVLVAEHNASQVTERDRDNKIVWKKQVDQPLVAQRLANGNTFIATREQLLEVDKEGKQVFSYTRPNGEPIMRAQRLPNGDIVMVTQPLAPRFVRLDRLGKKELSNFAVNVKHSGGRVEVLPNGNVLIPENENNRLVELDAQGKVVAVIAIEQPIAAVRLSNGHTLITTMLPQRGAVELDRQGKEVWNYKVTTRVTRAYRR